jgi:hypothetical protein
MTVDFQTPKAKKPQQFCPAILLIIMKKAAVFVVSANTMFEASPLPEAGFNNA